jgi:hypothetical protein
VCARMHARVGACIGERTQPAAAATTQACVLCRAALPCAVPCTGFEAVSVAPVPPELSFKPRAGREWLGIWRRSTAAAAGTQAAGGGAGPAPAL